MPKATDRFLSEIRRSHTIYSYVDVISPTQERKRLVAVGGDINCDRTAQFRRAGRVECIDPLGEFIPDGPGGLLTPYGTELRPYRGVVYSDGTREVYPLGVFRLSTSSFVESSSSSGSSGVRIALSMFDRSRTVSRDKFTTNYVIPAATNVVNAIKLIIGRTFENIQYDSITSGLTTTSPKVYNAADDPWKACEELALSVGCEIYFDTEGDVVIAPPTDIDALPTPDFDYIEGHRNTMTDLALGYSDEPGNNGVIVTGASTGDELPPVRAEAWDMEPTSPTYRYGFYGEVPYFHNDSNVKTVADAQIVADSMLKGMLGFSSNLTVTSWVNPAMEAGDVVQVERAKMKVTGLYTVDQFTVPLRKEGTQSMRIRQKRRVG